MTPEELHQAILAAHDNEDRRSLVALYSEAATRAEGAGDIDATCFFLTQAYVFALETGHRDAGKLHSRLRSHGREE
ncbi:MAG: hypothetical protein AAGA26_04690 [Pseudomonadota bacterium]